jgi:rare lipoprotein A (peptidoglycan hydrolase)
MTAKNLQKKKVYRIAVFLCIFSIGSASASLCFEPTANIHSGFAAIIGRPAPRYANEKVTASWYGPRHHRKLTASRQRFDMYKNTLAHKTLPLGTKVRLVNPDNGRSAEGVVNDRGPYIKGRDVDVSYAMAKQLGFVKKGVTKLDIEMI